MSQEKDNARSQAEAQANSIVAMVNALNCNFERLEELKDEMESLEFDLKNAETDEEKKDAESAYTEWMAENKEEYNQLLDDANGNKDEEEAREAIQNDALSVEVRSAWYDPTSRNADSSPIEFKILLCTGGPAVQIRGELDEYLQPHRAWIEYQDWGTPWSEAPGIIEQETLLTYCQQFYFGE